MSGARFVLFNQTDVHKGWVPTDKKVILLLDYIRNNAEHNKQWQDLQLLQDKNLGYSYGNNPLDDSGLGGIMPNAMDESVQTVSTISFCDRTEFAGFPYLVVSGVLTKTVC